MAKVMLDANGIEIELLDYVEAPLPQGDQQGTATIGRVMFMDAAEQTVRVSYPYPGGVCNAVNVSSSMCSIVMKADGAKIGQADGVEKTPVEAKVETI
jgi:hypothetical protein